MRQEKIDVITMGIPNKGVLNEGSVKLLAEAGLDYKRNPKQYLAMAPFYERVGGFAKAQEQPYPIGAVQLAFMRPADIVRRVASGDLDLGIAGSDTSGELQLEPGILNRLDFGDCTLVVATSEDFKRTFNEKKQISPSSDRFGLWQQTFEGLKVGTPYPNLAEKYFRSTKANVDIFEVDGASEGLIKLGWADAIVDLTETGSALKENGLAIFDRIENCFAQLIASPETEAIRNADDFTGSNKFVQLLINRLNQADSALYGQRRRKEIEKQRQTQEDEEWAKSRD